MIENLILASGSPRRRELLSALGWHFKVIPSQAAEVKKAGELPADMVCRLASLKARDVAQRFPGNWVLGADTVVASDGVILGKPHDEAEACSMIASLSGKSHSVFTGVALIAPDGRMLVKDEETRVTFRTLTAEEISTYVGCGESLDKAGAYAVQGYGMLLAERIEGCYFNVVGLPISLVSKMFAELGVTLSMQWGR